MLEEIKVKNFAILEDIDVKFESGMTVLTGQTGAGKSLIIDSISLLLGARADLDMIRYGEKESNIVGIFKDVSQNVLDLCDSFGIPQEEKLQIERQITLSGKNSIKVNHTPITLQQLKQIGLYLGDIHVQHDTYRLINKDNYLSFLDDFKDKKFLSLYNNYQLARRHYFDDLKKYNDSVRKNHELSDKLDFLTFQKEELEALGLEPEMDTKLEQEIEKLSNFDKIFTGLNEAYQKLDQEPFTIDNIYEAGNLLKNVEEFDSEYKKAFETLMDVYYQLDEVKSYLYKAKDSLDFDPNYLEECQTKLYEIEKIKDKYKMSVTELIKYLSDITLELSLITNYDETIRELFETLKSSHEKLCSASMKLHDYRVKESKELSKDIVDCSKSLDLEHTKFEVAFTEVDMKDPMNSAVFLDNGIDTIDFMITFNVGEPLKPLSKVASGGELSRIMLAFKTIYLKKNALSFMVFDEIDSGISGLTARKIAIKMHEISKNVQVLAITHLPQVASIADTQLFIAKEEENNRTKTIIKKLDYEERITEIATMLSGLELSPSFLDTAKAMLDSYK